MKKLLTLGFIILMLLSLSGQAVFYGPQQTLTWDTTHVSTPYVTYTYELWFDDGIAQTFIIEVASPPVLVDIPPSVYNIGVRAVRTIGADVSYSDFTWADPEGADGPFLLAGELSLGAVGGFRVQ